MNTDRNTRILEMRRTMTLGQIASELGVKRNVVSGVCYRAVKRQRKSAPATIRVSGVTLSRLRCLEQ